MSTRLLRLMEQVKYQQKWPTCDTRAFAEPQNRDSWLKVTVFFSLIDSATAVISVLITEFNRMTVAIDSGRRVP